jgi:hypothetical protein
MAAASNCSSDRTSGGTGPPGWKARRRAKRARRSQLSRGPAPCAESPPAATGNAPPACPSAFSSPLSSAGSRLPSPVVVQSRSPSPSARSPSPDDSRPPSPPPAAPSSRSTIPAEASGGLDPPAAPEGALTARQLKSRAKNKKREARRKAKGEPARVSASRKATKAASRRAKKAARQHAFVYEPPADFENRHPAAMQALPADALHMKAASTAWQGLPYRYYDSPEKLDTFVRGVFDGDTPFPMLEGKEWTLVELIDDHGFMLVRWDGV